MKNKYVFVSVLLAAILVISMVFTNIYVGNHQTEEDDDFVVVTSFYPMYIAAMNVIGETEGVTLKNLSEPQTGCLHDFQLTPADMKLLSTADVFVINGGGIESFMEEIAEQYPDLQIVEACAGIDLLSNEDGDVHSAEEHEEIHGTESDDIYNEEVYGTEIDETDELHDHDIEDAHNHDVNAHAWMSVELYRQQIKNIADGLAKADVIRKEIYSENAGIYDDKLIELQAEQEAVLDFTQGQPAIMFHCAYDYLAMDMGIDVRFCMDLDEERQVSAGEVAQVLEVIAHDDVRYIFAEELYGASMCEMIQREADVMIVYLDPLNRGEYDADSYLRGMRNNMQLIQMAME